MSRSIRAAGPLAVGFAIVMGALRATRGGGTATAVRAPVRRRPPPAPTFPLAGPCTTAWREEMLTKERELSALASWIYANRDPSVDPGELAEAISVHLDAARNAAAGNERTWRHLWGRFASSSGGSSFERALGNLDAVETDLLRLAPDSYLVGQLPSLQAHVNRFLGKDDPRRQRLDMLASADPVVIGPADRESLVAAYHAANTQRRRDLVRVRSFRNFLAAGTAILTVAAVSLVFIGRAEPTWIPVCFYPEEQHKFVCPLAETPTSASGVAEQDALVASTADPNDILLIELAGLIAAAVAAGAALRGMRGTSTPYGVPVTLALLKLPTGALTAVLGLLLMRGGFVPGLSALDTSAQILAWAIVFGYAQQLFTRLIDNQAHGLLNDVGGHGAAGDRPRAAD